MTTDDTTAMVDPVQILAQHADFVANGARHCTCGLWSDDTDDAQYTRVPFVHHTLAQLALYGYAVDTDSVPQLKAENKRLREVAAGLVKSFREVESRGDLYDAATHRWVDLLDEVVKAVDS